MVRNQIQRRSLLKAAGAAGIVGLAGCLGDDSDADGTGSDENGVTQVELATATSGSSSQANASALSVAADEHSDVISIATTLTDGWAANPYLYDSGENYAISTDTYTALNAANQAGQFEESPVSTLPGQGMHLSADQLYLVAVDGSGIESTADIGPEHNIYPTQPGFGARDITLELFEASGLDDQIDDYVDINVDDAAGAVEEDRIDALVVYGGNSLSLVGWAVEVDVRSDLHLVELEDSVVDAIDDVDGLRMETLSPEDHGWEQDITGVTDEIVSWVQDGLWWFGPEVSNEAAYEICRLRHEHNDLIMDTDSQSADHSDPADMTNGFVDDLPIHEGAAEFYREHDVWDDNWTEGNEYEI